MVATKLTKQLTSKAPSRTELQTGVLTVDSEKRLMPLKGEDKAVSKYPIIGVWVSGLTLPDRKYESKEDRDAEKIKVIEERAEVWTACTRFLLLHDLFDRKSISSSKEVFLLVVFFTNASSPAFIEF